MPAADTVALRTWVQTRLTGDAALMALVSGVFRDRAPGEVPLPVVVVTRAGSRYAPSFSGEPATGELAFTVRAVGDGNDLDGLAPVLERLHALLVGVRAVLGTGLSATLHLTGDVDYTERAQNREYTHAGFILSASLSAS